MMTCNIKAILQKDFQKRIEVFWHFIHNMLTDNSYYYYSILNFVKFSCDSLGLSGLVKGGNLGG